MELWKRERMAWLDFCTVGWVGDFFPARRVVIAGAEVFFRFRGRECAWTA
jgi:hypothetical protein